MEQRKRMVRRILTFLLALTMIVGMMPELSMKAQAAEKSGSVALSELQVGDFIGPDVTGLTGEGTIILKAGGYEARTFGDSYHRVGSEDIIVSTGQFYPFQSASKADCCCFGDGSPSGKLSFADVSQPVVFKSSRPESAFIDENGLVSARKSGKSTFTTKINGKTITVNVSVTD